MKIDLTFDELDVLEAALSRALTVMENELVHTEAPSLQHALAKDVKELRSVRDIVKQQTH